MHIRSSLFDGLSAAELAEVASRLEHRRFSVGASLVEEGDLRREFYIIWSGSAQLFTPDTADPGDHPRLLGPGAVLGEMPVLTGQHAAFTAKATSELEVLVV